MPKILSQHPLIAVTVLLVLALLAWGFWPEPVRVEVGLVERKPLVVTVEEEGRTRVMDRYVIAAPVDGVTCRLNLEVGDPVGKGDVLLHIAPLHSQVLDPRGRARAEAVVSAAEAALRAAEEQEVAAVAAADLAAAELARLRPLVDRGVVTRDAFDKAETQVKSTAAARQSAAFRVDVARYELQAARTALEYGASTTAEDSGERVQVRSPIEGQVLKIEHECEGPVQTGEPLLEVGDPDALEVLVEVLSPDAVRIEPGMPVLFERWGGSGPLEGRVRTVEPVGFTKLSALGVEEQRVRIIADFTSPAETWRRLGDGYRVEARFVLWQQDTVLQAPASSLFRHGAGWAVFVIDSGRARLRTVEIGQRTGLAAEVVAGLRDGERVVAYPSDEVDDGVRVTPWFN
jgi:HlyD family secretion protein